MRVGLAVSLFDPKQIEKLHAYSEKHNTRRDADRLSCKKQ